MKQSWIGPTLVECLVGDDTKQAGPMLRAHWATAPDKLMGAAIHHSVAMALWEKLPSKDGQPDGLRNLMHRSVGHHLTVLADLRRLVASLDRAGIRSVAMKGPVLAELAYARSHLRTYGDLDLMVEPGAVATVLQLLDDAGAVSADYPWDQLVATEQSQLSVRLASGTLLDLHWNYFNDPSARRAFSIPSSEVLDRSVRADLGGFEAPVQDPTDRLLHVCVHGTLSGGFRLCWSQDVRRLLLTSPPEWDLLTERAQRSGTSLAVAAMLQRAADVLGAPVPDRALISLAGGPWLEMARRLTRLRPPQSSAVLTGNFFYAATRRNTLDSARQMIGSLWRGALSPALHDPDHPWRHSHRRRPAGQPAAPSIPLRGADESRDRWLRWVEGTG